MMRRKREPMYRDWKDARAKVDQEGACRNCNRPEGAVRLEAAHTMGRDFDEVLSCPKCDGTGEGKRTATKCSTCRGHGCYLYVDPRLIVPLCGPATTTSTCHGMHHNAALDMLAILSGDEQVAAVEAVVRRGKRVSGSGNIGIAEAYRRLTLRPEPEGDPAVRSGSVVAHVTQQPPDQPELWHGAEPPQAPAQGRSIYSIIEDDAANAS